MQVLETRVVRPTKLIIHRFGKWNRKDRDLRHFVQDKVNKFVHCTSLLLESLKAFPGKLLKHEAAGVLSVVWIEDAMDETI